jgi:hypothetical protein
MDGKYYTHICVYVPTHSKNYKVVNNKTGLHDQRWTVPQWPSACLHAGESGKPLAAQFKKVQASEQEFCWYGH